LNYEPEMLSPAAGARTTSALIYCVDGCALSILNAQNTWPYTSLHWLPVALDIKAKPKSGELK